jgi:hypothetical protein
VDVFGPGRGRSPNRDDPYLGLLDTNQNLLASNDDSFGTDSLIEGYVLPRDDRYTIVARGYAGETGSYTLSLERTDSGIEIGAGGGEIEFGETVNSRVTSANGDEWMFSGREGDEIRVEMRSSTLDSYLELYDPSGRMVASDDDGGGNLDSLIEGYVLPDSGTYTIMASSYSGEDGSYRLSLERTDSGVEIGVGGEIDFGETVDGRVMTERGDEWTFTAGAGDVVTIDMESRSLDTYRELLDPDGRLIAEDDDGGDNTNSKIDNFWLEEGGTYTIVALGYSGDIGPYDLTLERIHEGSDNVLAGGDSTLLVGTLVAFSLLCLMVIIVAGAIGVVVFVQRRQPYE